MNNEIKNRLSKQFDSVLDRLQDMIRDVADAKEILSLPNTQRIDTLQTALEGIKERDTMIAALSIAILITPEA